MQTYSSARRNFMTTIRPVRLDDFPEWKRLWDSYNAFYGREHATALADNITHATWSRFFELDEPMHALVAERPGELVGIAHFLFHRTTTRLAMTCYLEDLFTAEPLRGMGVGRALIGSVCESADAMGSDRVYWHTHETNLRAQILYDRVAQRSGFVVYVKKT